MGREEERHGIMKETKGKDGDVELDAKPSELPHK